MGEENLLELRRVVLYNTLERLSTVKKGQWISQEEIIENVNTYLRDIYCVTPETMYHASGEITSHDLCAAINQDVIAINNSDIPIFRKIIIQENCHFKIATPEEARYYIEKLYTKAIKCLKRVSMLNKKVRRNGQTCMDFKKNVIDVIETFEGE